ncbi:MAG: protein-L-isoaspartate O-methyltransferase [Thermoplasmata archaeon]|nr:protein-L-isoaspartate O-methyltransferase [Thermoplasmata archaeon]
MVRGLGSLPPKIARVMESVPRHRFVPDVLRKEAYEDTPLPLANDRSTISAPHMVAFQLDWADLGPGLRVLEIGSGSGYLLALAANLTSPGGQIVGVELDEELAEGSRDILNQLGYGTAVTVATADGRAGWPDQAPYDRILVSCATPEVFPAWLDQLATPGILVAPVGSPFDQILRRLRRSLGLERWQDGPECRFVSLVGR